MKTSQHLNLICHIWIVGSLVSDNSFAKVVMLILGIWAFVLAQKKDKQGK